MEGGGHTDIGVGTGAAENGFIDSKTGDEEDVEPPLFDPISWDSRFLPPQFGNEGLPRRVQHVLERFLTLCSKRKVIADVQEDVGLDECSGSLH